MFHPQGFIPFVRSLLKTLTASPNDFRIPRTYVRSRYTGLRFQIKIPCEAEKSKDRCEAFHKKMMADIAAPIGLADRCRQSRHRRAWTCRVRMPWLALILSDGELVVNPRKIEKQLWNNCKNAAGAVDFRRGRGIVRTVVSTLYG